MSKIIGKVSATERVPTTIDEFFFWTDKEKVLNPFDVIKASHIEGSTTFGVVEEISHITDAANYLTSYISHDFGDISFSPNTQRVGMNFVKAKVIGNTKNIYTPVIDGSEVGLADQDEVKVALGLDRIKFPLPCGYVEMYMGDDKIQVPVNLNSHFLIGPEGSHLNISGISGLAAKTSYAMFLINAIQHEYLKGNVEDKNESIAFVFFNVKGRDILAIDEPNDGLSKKDIDIYKMIGLDSKPFENVTYFYPYYSDDKAYTFSKQKDFEMQIAQNSAYKYKYIYEDDKDSIDLLFANDDDPTDTMNSILNYVLTGQGNFGGIRSWKDFIDEIDEHCKAKSGKTHEIQVQSWRKFKRYVRKAITNKIFAKRVDPNSNETRLRDHILNKLNKNDVFVIDIAQLSEDMQSFVFGDVIKSIYDLKLGLSSREEDEIPSKIIVFIDELNKYASTDVPKRSPILRQIMDISERGRSLGIILFSAEQFKSAIVDRVTGNCATHAYGRTNAIEMSKSNYKFIPKVYKNIMTRLEQGQYIIENPILRSMLHIKFPKPTYRQFK